MRRMVREPAARRRRRRLLMALVAAAGAAVALAPRLTDSPAARTKLVARAVDHARVRLEWTPVPRAKRYRVARGGLVVGRTPATSFTDVLLWPEQRYSYRVDALDRAGRTAASFGAEATTKPLPATGFRPVFGRSSVWSRPVGDAPLHPRSAALSAYLASRARAPNMTLHMWGVSVAEAHPADPRYRVRCTVYEECSLDRFGRIPIPVTARPDPAGDGHLAVYDPRRRREWGMWQARRRRGQWSASSGAAVSLAGDGIASPGVVGPSAANFPLLGGLIRPEEILQGRIDHALVFAMPGVGKGSPVCPATHSAGVAPHRDAPREGQRFQLDPSVDVEALPLPRWQKTIARALQEYGMYLRDSGGALTVYAENPVSRGYDAWRLLGFGKGGWVSLAAIPWHRFRALAPPPGC